MKLLLTLLPALLTQTTGRRNQRIVIGFLLFTTVLVALFSIVDFTPHPLSLYASSVACGT